MFENLVFRFRRRWQAILIVTLMLLALSPAPVHTRWVSALNSASIALESGRADQGLMDIEAALAAEPGLASLHLLASDLAFQLDEQDRSLKHLELAQQVFQADQIGFCRLARSEALPEFENQPDETWLQLIKECPSARQRASQAVLRQFADTPELSLLPYLEQLHRVQPDKLDIRSAYARLLSVHKPQQAEEHFRALINNQAEAFELERDLLRAIRTSSADQSQAFTLAQVGQVLARHHEWQLARIAFEASVSLDPDYADALAYLGLAMEQLNLNGYEALTAAIRANPQDPRTHVFLAIHYQKRGEIEMARETLDEAAGLDPDNPAIAAQLGSIYAEIGDFSAATQAYLLATELVPDDPEFWMLLAGYSLEHDIDLEGIGLPAARNAISVAPQDPRAYAMLGTIQFNLENFVLAERSLRTALDVDRRLPASQYAYGLLMLASGRRQAADAAFTAASLLDQSGYYDQLTARFLDR